METKIQALNLCFSCEMFTIIDNLGLTTEQKKDIDASICAVKNHIDGHRNESMEQHALR